MPSQEPEIGPQPEPYEFDLHTQFSFLNISSSQSLYIYEYVKIFLAVSVTSRFPTRSHHNLTILTISDIMQLFHLRAASSHSQAVPVRVHPYRTPK
jgi:hypothetical protein